jgi:hypothetical protein
MENKIDEEEIMQNTQEVDQTLVKCANTECGHIIDLVRENGYIIDNLPACEKCKNKYCRGNVSVENKQ